MEETEDRFEENIVETLISRDAASPAIADKLKKLDLDLMQPYTAMVIKPAETAFEHNGIIREVISLLPQSLSCLRGGSLVVLLPVKPGNSQDEIWKPGKKLIESLIKGLNNSLTMGIGRPYPGHEGIRRSFLEAEQALTMGIKLYGKGSITSFGDLGVHRLLFSLKSTGELKTFYTEYLGKLIDYEHQPDGELEKTLKAYLKYHTIADTARAIHVHRNTLLYRLSRIREITGLDLEDGETRLALYLAILAGEVSRIQ